MFNSTPLRSERLVFNNFQASNTSPLPPKTTVDRTNSVVLKEIPKIQSSTQKVCKALKIIVKVLFFPVTLLLYCIQQLFSKIANPIGLGNSDSLKQINLPKREVLQDLKGQPIRFGFEKQPSLEGMYFEAEKKNSGTKTILICTGSHSSYENYAIPMVKALKEKGHNVMIFNYQGFGDSEGFASEKNIYASTKAAYQYLKQEKACNDQDIVAWGYSLGSAAVTKLASKHKVSIVIDRGFSSMSEVAYQTAANGTKLLAKFIFFMGAHFDNLSRLKKIKGKVFIAQGEKDLTMKLNPHGKLLQKAILHNSKAIFRIVDSAHIHTDKVWFEKGKDSISIQEFLDQKS